jgi:hypothetical protein
LARYDSIIIGAGHNGLVCAAYLARSGQSVLVLEASDTAGGLAANREFHPGFHSAVAQSVSHFPQQIVDDLKLSSHGYESAPNPLPTIGLSDDKDVASYQSYIKSMQRDKVQLGSIDVAITKAKTALMFRRPTGFWEDTVAAGRQGYLAPIEMLPIEGGVPLTYNDQIVGAIGVSGVKSSEDGQIAEAGASALPQA